MRLLPVVCGVAAALGGMGQTQAAPRGTRGGTVGPSGVITSPCGRHNVTIRGGAVAIDGRRVHAAWERVQLAGQPVWRDDSNALAWVEKWEGRLRLVVITEVAHPEQALYWALPTPAAGEQVAWAGPHRVVVGNDLLSPRAVATWSEE